jgi:hypothetical protein
MTVLEQPGEDSVIHELHKDVIVAQVCELLHSRAHGIVYRLHVWTKIDLQLSSLPKQTQIVAMLGLKAFVGSSQKQHSQKLLFLSKDVHG